MTANELEARLRTPQSKSVGQKKTAGAESVGHASGRRIVTIPRAGDEALSEQDYLHMLKVVGFIRRHRAREPANMVTSRWRYSLLNWGHDPLK
jgi:hypothetical protein